MGKRLRAVEIKVAVLRERLRGADQRLTVQAIEYQRRLTELSAWQSAVDRQLSELAGRSKGITAAQAMVLSLIPILLAVAAFFYRN